jgi:hypothetical protein
MIGSLIVDDDADVRETREGRLAEATKNTIKFGGLLGLHPGRRVYGHSK